MIRFCCWILVGMLIAGCKPSKTAAPSTGAYGPMTNAPTPVARPVNDALQRQPWLAPENQLAIIESELTPAVLMHANGRTLSLFTGTGEAGLGAPSHVCISTEQGPKIFKPGDVIDPARMRESWFVLWWSGASGWTNWDVPFFVTLQRRPATIQFTTNGLQLKFNQAGGYAALLPLYGYDKSMPEAARGHPFVEGREKKKRVLTWEWHKALPADPLSRARYWASALREFPVSSEEDFTIDRARDSVSVSSRIQWISWNDDWNTKHLKLAPVSPVLALAFHEEFPATFSTKPFDMEVPTLFGPLYGVQEKDQFTVTLPVLRYVHETLGAGEPTGWKTAPCYDAWQRAHSSGNWDAARIAWTKLREEFVASATVDWRAFGPVSMAPLENAANCLGAARMAYRLGDANTYALASSRFARAMVQVIAQQRGADYLRAHQPWHTMSVVSSNVVLGMVSQRGWQFGNAVDESALRNYPDLMRIWRDAQPRFAQTLMAQTERLIPGAAATPSMPDIWTDGVIGNPVLAVEVGPSGARFFWPEWKTSTGEDWSFGRVTGNPAPKAARVVPLSANARVLLW